MLIVTRLRPEPVRPLVTGQDIWYDIKLKASRHAADLH
jgi:hypothetical protein